MNPVLSNLIDSLLYVVAIVAGCCNLDNIFENFGSLRILMTIHPHGNQRLQRLTLLSVVPLYDLPEYRDVVELFGQIKPADSCCQASHGFRVFELMNRNQTVLGEGIPVVRILVSNNRHRSGTGRTHTELRLQKGGPLKVHFTASALVGTRHHFQAPPPAFAVSFGRGPRFRHLVEYWATIGVNRSSVVAPHQKPATELRRDGEKSSASTEATCFIVVGQLINVRQILEFPGSFHLDLSDNVSLKTVRCGFLFSAGRFVLLHELNGTNKQLQGPDSISSTGGNLLASATAVATFKVPGDQEPHVGNAMARQKLRRSMQ